MLSRALIFDFDDLLCNSAPLHVAATVQAFARLGIACALPAEFQATLYGRRIPDATALICDYLQVTVDMPSYLASRGTLFRDLVRQSLGPMPGLDRIVALTQSLGMPHALASSGDREYLTVGLQRLGLGDFFSVIVSGEEVRRGKPDPEVFLVAAERLGIPAAQCTVLEDAALGIAAAKSAGMRAIGVRNPYSAIPQDLSAADCIVDQLGQITAEMLTG